MIRAGAENDGPYCSLRAIRSDWLQRVAVAIDVLLAKGVVEADAVCRAMTSLSEDVVILTMAGSSHRVGRFWFDDGDLLVESMCHRVRVECWNPRFSTVSFAALSSLTCPACLHVESPSQPTFGPDPLTTFIKYLVPGDVDVKVERFEWMFTTRVRLKWHEVCSDFTIDDEMLLSAADRSVVHDMIARQVQSTLIGMGCLRG